MVPTPIALVAAPLVRLLAATVDVVADGYDPLAGDPALRQAASSAASALRGLVDDHPEATEHALDELLALAAAAPAPPPTPPAPPV
jgi:hypothetical protein